MPVNHQVCSRVLPGLSSCKNKEAADLTVNNKCSVLFVFTPVPSVSASSASSVKPAEQTQSYYPSVTELNTAHTGELLRV